MTALPRNQVLTGDARTVLATLPSDSVDCVITSPPYFALRNYQVAGQLGLEPSVEQWVEQLVAVLDEVARVLKPEGSLWLNLGDSYSRRDGHGAPPKGLLLAPERLLLKLTERGWLVRNKVVWAKPNSMPASVRDRLTCAWEPVYFLVRSRRYFFDLDAVRVPHRTVRRPQPSGRAREGRTRPSAWAGPLAGSQDGLDRLKAAGRVGHPLGKNPGDVWTIPTSAFRGGHFATFPPALVTQPLLATCPERTCRACGLAWRRQTARRLGRLAVATTSQLLPVCGCAADWQPGVVLDPFIGSGTTAVVAERHGRDWLGIELNLAFTELAEQRVAADRTQREAVPGGDEQRAA